MRNSYLWTHIDNVFLIYQKLPTTCGFREASLPLIELCQRADILLKLNIRKTGSEMAQVIERQRKCISKWKILEGNMHACYDSCTHYIRNRKYLCIFCITCSPLPFLRTVLREYIFPINLGFHTQKAIYDSMWHSLVLQRITFKTKQKSLLTMQAIRKNVYIIIQKKIPV